MFAQLLRRLAFAGPALPSNVVRLRPRRIARRPKPEPPPKPPRPQLMRFYG